MSTANMPYIGIAHRTRKSPFFDATVAFGVQGFSVYNHMLMPVFYADPVTDYWGLLNSVSCWDVACERQVEISGPDATKLMQLLTPRNLSKFKIGQCKYVLITDENGGIINDPVALRIGEQQYWLSLADSDVLLWAQGVAYGKGLDVTITEPDVSPLAIQGPNADEVAAALLGEWVRDLRFFWFREFELDDIPMVVARSGWSKQGGFELYLRDGSKGVDLWNRVMEAGQPWDIKPGTPSTIERIETGLLSWGNDMTQANNPFEIELGKYCDLDMEADFIGKAALRKIKEAGITQKLVGVEIDGVKKPGNEHWWKLWDGEKPAGHITSATYSPRLEKNIAFAMVPIQYAAVGTTLTVDTPWEQATATVSPLPFIEEPRR